MKKTNSIVIIAILLLIVGIGFIVMNKEDKSESVTPQNNVEATKIEAALSTDISIKDFAFSPISFTVKKGATVTWSNNDTAPHTVTSQGASTDSFDSGSIAVGKTFSHTFTTTGKYNYICSFHSNMSATIVVTE